MDAVGYTGMASSRCGLGCRLHRLARPVLRRARRSPAAPAVLAALDDWLRAYQPTAVLYFSGSKDSAYQVNMWLETMERLEGRPLIILRERAIVAQLGPPPCRWSACPAVCT